MPGSKRETTEKNNNIDLIIFCFDVDIFLWFQVFGSFVVTNLCHPVTLLHCNGVTVTELTIMRFLVVFLTEMGIYRYYRSE